MALNLLVVGRLAWPKSLSARIPTQLLIFSVKLELSVGRRRLKKFEVRQLFAACGE